MPLGRPLVGTPGAGSLHFDFRSPVIIYRSYSIHAICDLLIVLVPYGNFVKTGLCVPPSLE
jgi:hypothetical protein